MWQWPCSVFLFQRPDESFGPRRGSSIRKRLFSEDFYHATSPAPFPGRGQCTFGPVRNAVFGGQQRVRTSRPPHDFLRRNKEFEGQNVGLGFHESRPDVSLAVRLS